MGTGELAFCWACLLLMGALFGIFLRTALPRAMREGEWASAGLLILAAGLFVVMAVALAQATLLAWAGPTSPLL